ncbi:MAG: hypothetical protein EBS50_08715 [Sphingomonadaceae bacterium]|nr:hypothetical protein [Sphingomonadaceae bacterium]
MVSQSLPEIWPTVFPCFAQKGASHVWLSESIASIVVTLYGGFPRCLCHPPSGNAITASHKCVAGASQNKQRSVIVVSGIG